MTISARADVLPFTRVDVDPDMQPLRRFVPLVVEDLADGYGKDERLAARRLRRFAANLSARRDAGDGVLRGSA